MIPLLKLLRLLLLLLLRGLLRPFSSRIVVVGLPLRHVNLVAFLIAGALNELLALVGVAKVPKLALPPHVAEIDSLGVEVRKLGVLELAGLVLSHNMDAHA